MYSSGEVGRRIKRFRQARGLTASELGRRVGITENAVRKLEAGDSREPRFSTGLKIARVLEVDPAMLVPIEDQTGDAPDLARVVHVVRSLRTTLLKLGVAHAAVFGSVARGEADAGSDVDIVVDPAPETHLSLLTVARMQELLQHALGRRVDIVVRATLERSRFAARALREAVDAF